MKIKKAISLCAASGRIILYDLEEGTQWVSNGYAAYKLDGVPHLAVDQLCAMYDLTGKKLEKIQVEQRPVPDVLSFEDYRREDEDLRQLEMLLCWRDEIIQPVILPEGMTGYKTKFLAPLTGKDEFRRAVVRRSAPGMPYFCIMDGVNIQAMIMPMCFARGMEPYLAALSTAARELVMWEPRTGPAYDPDTGEVLDNG